jgi:hypothetical protein
VASAETHDACLNCAEPLGGRAFCGACGQRSLHRRLRWRDLARDLGQHFADFDLPWPRTLLDLTRAPGQTARAYLDGRRTRYVNPVKYAFYALLISILLSGGIAQDWVTPQLTGWRRVLATNLPLYLLLMSPVAVVALRAAFWRTRHNLIEIAVFVLYMVGQVSLLFLLLGLVGAAVPPAWWAVVPALLVTVPSVYLLYASARFFDARLDHAIVASLLALAATMWVAAKVWLRIAGY